MASETNLRFTVNVPIYFNSEQRLEVGRNVIKRVVERTREEYKNKNNRKFPGYSQTYISSKAFLQGGKSKNEVNLTLTGEMIDDLDIVEHGVGYVDIGYKTSYTGAGKVEGNVIGSYGREPNTKHARDFLGIKKDEAEEFILKVETKTEEEQIIQEVTEEEINKAVENILSRIEL